MTDARSKVLARIARQIRTGAVPPAASIESPAAAPLPPAGDAALLVAAFTREFEALTGIVHRARDEAEAAAQVLAILDKLTARRVLAWDDDQLTAPSLGPALRAAGVTVEPCRLVADPEQRTARLRALDDVPVGLTGAQAALADTGSIVVISGPGRGRIASLLPPVHVAVVRTSDIVPSFAHFLASHPSAADEGSNLVIITGPSRTADIEMTLTRGVHGPREVHVVLIP